MDTVSAFSLSANAATRECSVAEDSMFSIVAGFEAVSRELRVMAGPRLHGGQVEATARTGLASNLDRQAELAKVLSQFARRQQHPSERDNLWARREQAEPWVWEAAAAGPAAQGSSSIK